MKAKTRKSAPSSRKPRTKAAMRRLIARDVIAQIRAKKLRPDTGTFVSLSGNGIGGASFKTTLSLKDEIRRAQPQTCSVCALGGLMMGQLNMNGDCKGADIYIDSTYDCITISPLLDDPKNYAEPSHFSPFILRYFTVSQLQLIEMAYEEGTGAFPGAEMLHQAEYNLAEDVEKEALRDYGIVLSVYQVDKAIAFGERYSNSNEARLIAIMEKIAKHPQGLFVP